MDQQSTRTDITVNVDGFWMLQALLDIRHVAPELRCRPYVSTDSSDWLNEHPGMAVMREQGIVVGDEVLTPDSSCFWPADGFEPGHGQPSFDKQYVRDWAAGTGWDKKPPAPAIPDDVVAGTRARYVEAYGLIAGEPFERWLARSGALADGA